MTKMQYSNFRKLYETDIYIVVHEYETAYLFNKINGEQKILGEFYGDPSCALIDKENKWCIVGGSTLSLWLENEVYEIKDDNLYGACKIRQVDASKVEILIDPWADNSSIWEFDIQTRVSKKIKDFDIYRDKEYTDEIEW